MKHTWKHEFTTVTPFSKSLALGLFIIIPVIGFYLGTLYQQILDVQKIPQYPVQNHKTIRIITPTSYPSPTISKKL